MKGSEYIAAAARAVTIVIGLSLRGVERYVGPETPELLARIERHRQQKESQSLRRKLVVTLTRTYGLSAPLPAVGNVVVGLAKAGVFRLRGVLEGTVAFQTYPALLGSRFRGAMAPLDAYFYWHNDVDRDPANS